MRTGSGSRGCLLDVSTTEQGRGKQAETRAEQFTTYSPCTHHVTDELLLFRLKHEDTEFVIVTKHSKTSGK